MKIKKLNCCYGLSLCSPKKWFKTCKKNLKIKIQIPRSKQAIRVHYPKMLWDSVENWGNEK